jgi:hypothetical protein
VRSMDSKSRLGRKYHYSVIIIPSQRQETVTEIQEKS